MSIKKKSLISNRTSVKKANVAKAPGVASVSSPKLNPHAKIAMPHSKIAMPQTKLSLAKVRAL